MNTPKFPKPTFWPEASAFFICHLFDFDWYWCPNNMNEPLLYKNETYCDYMSLKPNSMFSQRVVKKVYAKYLKQDQTKLKEEDLKPLTVVRGKHTKELFVILCVTCIEGVKRVNYYNPKMKTIYAETHIQTFLPAFEKTDTVCKILLETPIS